MAQLLHVQVEHYIQEYITNNELKPGTSLPSERTLAEHCHVSRNVVRQALKNLSEKRIIDLIPKCGATVAFSSDENIVRSIREMLATNQDMIMYALDVREVIESSIVEKCMNNINESFLIEMDNIWEKMDEYRIEKRVEPFLKADMEFHERIAKQLPNPFFHMILKGVFLDTPQIFDVTRTLDTAMADTQFEHKLILDGLHRNDTELATLAIHLQISNIRRDLQTVLFNDF